MSRITCLLFLPLMTLSLIQLIQAQESQDAPDVIVIPDQKDVEDDEADAGSLAGKSSNNDYDYYYVYEDEDDEDETPNKEDKKHVPLTQDEPSGEDQKESDGSDNIFVGGRSARSHIKRHKYVLESSFRHLTIDSMTEQQIKAANSCAGELTRELRGTDWTSMTKSYCEGIKRMFVCLKKTNAFAKLKIEWDNGGKRRICNIRGY